jgi:two-component system, LytTR family, sensor kinase
MFKKGPIQIYLWVILFGVNLGFIVHIMPINAGFVSAFINVLFLALVFYGNYFFIFPRYFNLQHNKRFYVITFLFIVTISFLHAGFDLTYFSKHVFRSPSHEGPRYVFMFIRAFFSLSLVDMISNFFLMQDRIKQQIVHAQQMKEEKLNTELKLLKAQINPHFVFNALNNIYSLTYTKSDNAPDSILKLSQMLRYVLEECSHDRVALRSEIEYIENFISFQRMKSPNGQNINFEHENVDSKKMIAPMLFIPFIENSFKYSRIEEEQNAFVNIRMNSDKENVHFEIRNSIADSGRTKPGAGMGIENVKQRLNIIYPDNYTLDISNENEEFCVTLGITLK